MKQRPKTLESLLQKFSDEHPPLHSIVQQSHALSQLSDALNTILPEEMRSHIRAANFNQGTLVLQISSAAWQLRLNYYREELIDKLRQSILPGLVSVTFKINPDILSWKQEKFKLNTYKLKAPIQFTLDKPRKISPETGKILLTLSNEAPPKLSDALKKMAMHAFKPPTLK
ncbi:DUF721 domain-containing protein [Thorsellia kenyensis]|uniref:DUF721 domain-containing protein n=1 Tax=Thorsellia kenyensis TaxID=1549888 RepID=A0ABV6CFW0_9GAMM